MKKTIVLSTINVLLAILWICFAGIETTACDRDNCYHNGHPMSAFSKYPDSYSDVNVDAKTPSGIQVDTGGFTVDLEELDRRIAQIYDNNNDSWRCGVVRIALADSKRAR